MPAAARPPTDDIAAWKAVGDIFHADLTCPMLLTVTLAVLRLRRTLD